MRTTLRIQVTTAIVALVAIAISIAGNIALGGHSAKPAAAATVAAKTSKTVDRHQQQAAATRSNRPAATTKAQPAKVKWALPMTGFELTSCYGPRWGTMHQGIDFAGPAGTPIRAVGSGTVFGAGWIYTGYGMSVVIDHGNGYFTHYAHASAIKVKAGQHVSAGQVIALEGSTGDSTGPHLHFEVHKGMWHQVDPAPWLRAHGVKVGC